MKKIATEDYFKEVQENPYRRFFVNVKDADVLSDICVEVLKADLIDGNLMVTCNEISYYEHEGEFWLHYKKNKEIELWPQTDKISKEYFEERLSKLKQHCHETAK